MALAGKKILITCGPTWVAIDDMRVISNRSSGEMGHLLAKALMASKAKVTLLEGPVTHSFSSTGIKIFKFSFFDELSALLSQELNKQYDCIIHAAAVSDFKPRRTLAKKIKSGSKLTLDFIPTPKLINTIKQVNPNIFLVGFKLENRFNSSSAIRETKNLFSQAKCDLVVANFMKKDGYEALVLDLNRSLLGKAKNKIQLVRLMVNILKQKL